MSTTNAPRRHASTRTQEQDTGVGHQLHANREPLALAHAEAVLQSAHHRVSHLSSNSTRHTPHSNHNHTAAIVTTMQTAVTACCKALPDAATTPAKFQHTPPMPYIVQLQQVDNVADAGLKLGLRLGLLQTLQSVRSTYHTTMTTNTRTHSSLQA